VCTFQVIDPYRFPNLIWLAIFAFLIGTIPFGLIIGRMFFRTDIRESGSGNIGAANALRSYGKVGAVAVLVLDVLKGYVPTASAIWYANWWWDHMFLNTRCPWVPTIGVMVAIGSFAVLGHCFSPWLGFKGGKGVATWLGILFALSWVVGGWIVGPAFIVIWLAVVVPTRYSSLGSIVATVLSPVVLWLAFQSVFHVHAVWGSVVAAIVALLIVWKHRDNIARLREGRENKIAFGRAAA